MSRAFYSEILLKLPSKWRQQDPPKHLTVYLCYIRVLLQLHWNLCENFKFHVSDSFICLEFITQA